MDRVVTYLPGTILAYIFVQNDYLEYPLWVLEMSPSLDGKFDGVCIIPLSTFLCLHSFDLLRFPNV